MSFLISILVGFLVYGGSLAIGLPVLLAFIFAIFATIGMSALLS